MRTVVFTLCSLALVSVATLSSTLSSCPEGPDDAVPTLMVTQHAMVLDGTTVVSLVDGEVPDTRLFGSLVGDLYDPLAERSVRPEVRALRVRLAADVPTDTMTDVLYTARQAGFASFDVEVDAGA